MLDRMMYKMYKAYWDVQFRLMGIASEDEEDGMEMLETIILVVVAIVIAGAVINLLTGDKDSGKGGVIERIFQSIEEQIEKLFS